MTYRILTAYIQRTYRDERHENEHVNVRSEKKKKVKKSIKASINKDYQISNSL